jgi:hypothetical protein
MNTPRIIPQNSLLTPRRSRGRGLRTAEAFTCGSMASGRRIALIGQALSKPILPPKWRYFPICPGIELPYFVAKYIVTAASETKRPL